MGLPANVTARSQSLPETRSQMLPQFVETESLRFARRNASPSALTLLTPQQRNMAADKSSEYKIVRAPRLPAVYFLCLPRRFFAIQRSLVRVVCGSRVTGTNFLVVFGARRCLLLCDQWADLPPI